MDEKLLLLINREWTSPALDKVMAAASCFEAWLPLIVVLVAAILIKGDFRARAFVVTALLVVAVNDGVVSKTLKRIVDRPRPHQSHSDVRIVDLAKAPLRITALLKPVKVRMSRPPPGDVEGRSFPSSHTINMMSVALVAVAFFGARAAWGFALAALVAYSRLYTGSHWPSDVVTSVFLGLGSTLMLLALAEWLWRKRGGWLLPRLHAAHPVLIAT